VTEMFVSGLVGWLIQEAGRAGIRKVSDPVNRALERVISDTVRGAVTRVYEGAELREHTIALLLERRATDLPTVDGTPLAHLDQAIREWVASIEHPVGKDGRLPTIRNHPLVGPLREEIIQRIHDEAIRGEGVLWPLWADYYTASNQRELLQAIEDVHRTVTAPIEYWHPPVLHMTTFVGREAELARLSMLDADSTVRLVHGIGGVGKTALDDRFHGVQWS
jgi:hypothetical protein